MNHSPHVTNEEYLERILQSMRARIPWKVAQRVFWNAELPTSLGWDRTIDKLVNPDIATAGNIDLLLTVLQEHTVSGEKLCTYFSLDDASMGELRRKILELAGTIKREDHSYPLSLTSSEMSEKEHGTEIVAVDQLNSGIAVIFSSIRIVRVRESISRHDLSETARSAIEPHDEIFVVRTKRTHAYDLLWVPSAGNLIDIRIDFPFDAHHEIAEAAANAITNRCIELFDRGFFQKRVNLFPLIDSIYGQPNEGKIVELAFATSTASLKHETMRRVGRDLRVETYHHHGKLGLQTPIEPFKLSVQWSIEPLNGARSTPELTLSGNSRAAGMIDPTLHSVILRKCIGNSDHEFVRQRLNHHLLNVSARAAAE